MDKIWSVLGCEKKRKKGLGRARDLYGGVWAAVRTGKVKVRDWHTAGGDDDATLAADDKNLGETRGERQSLSPLHYVRTVAYRDRCCGISAPRFAHCVSRNACSTAQFRGIGSLPVDLEQTDRSLSSLKVATSQE
jgi:hypothetical protein